MDVFEAIRTRRTVHEFAPDCPPRGLVEQMLEAATWAPNFWETEPWRFHVYAGAAREELGEVFAQARLESFVRKGQDPTTPANKARVRMERKVPSQAPVCIAAICIPQDDRPNVEPIEELEACATALQNLMLAAHALGLATKWQTAGSTDKPVIRAHYSLRPQDTLLGFIMAGYPVKVPKPHPRAPLAEKSHWYGWD